MAAERLDAKELRFLRELNKAGVRYIIVGLSAAALQGAPVVTQDVDLWFENITDERIKRTLRKVGAAYVPQIGLNPPMFAGDSVRLFDVVVDVAGVGTFADEYDSCLDISLSSVRVKILPLAKIIRSKQALLRPKDKLVLPVLQDVLRAIRERDAKKT